MSDLAAVKKDEIVEYNADRNAVVRKANELVSAKYKQSLLSNQLSSICLSRVQEQNGEFIATVTSSELKELFSLKDNNTKIYHRLLDASKEMVGSTLVAENDKGEFEVISVITKANYKDGIFSVRFNKDLNAYFYQLKGRYTTYALSNILNFKCPYSMRTYEVLKKDAFRITKDNPVAKVTYSLSEYKCTIGVVNLDSEKVKKELHNKVIDWDKVVDLASEKSFNKWDDFRRRVLDKTQKEINEQCDIRFDYKPVKAGKGAKVVKIEFFISKNDAERVKKNSKTRKEVEKLNRKYESTPFKPSPELLSYVGHNELKKRDLMTLLSDASGDNNLVIRAIEQCDKQPDIRNYVGWIRECVRNGGYEEGTPVLSGSAEKGRQVQKVREEVNNLSVDEQNEIMARYWDTAKNGNTEIFEKFEKYLHDNGIDIDMFESMHPKSICGEKYMDFVKNKTVELF